MDKRLEQVLLHSTKILESTKSLEDILHTISTQTTLLLNADRTTLYVYDPIKKELFSKIAENLEIDQIRLNLGEGIAGFVAEQKEILNIEDAYRHPRFNPAFDEQTKYKTQTLIAAPLLNIDNELVGVVQVLNKKENAFNDDDIKLLKIISKVSAIAIEQTQLYEGNYLLRRYSENIFRNINSGVIVTDVDFNVVVLNDKIKKIFPFPDKTFKKHISELFPFIEDLDEVLRIISSSEMTNLEERQLLINDEEYFIRIKSSRFADKSGNILGYIIMFEDNTKITLLKKEKLQNEKMSLIGDMTSNILHDLKNPLTAVKGYLYLIRTKSEDEKISNYAKLIEKDLDRVISMTHEVLDFARGETQLNKIKINVEKFFNEVEEYLNTLFENSGATVIVDCKCGGVVELDKDKIWRVIQNVSQNAHDAIKDAGIFNVTVNKVDDNLKITITDTGIGMDDETLINIFKPFFSKGKPSGTGLGMSIVQRIIEAHGGDVNVESELGKGTTVLISLPV